MKSIWKNKEFTKRNSITKTITMQLIPTDGTTAALEKDQIFETDKRIAEIKESLIPHMNVFFRHLIRKCLISVSLDWNTLFEAYVKRMESEKDAADYNSMLDSYTKKMSDYFKKEATKINEKFFNEGNFTQNVFPDFVRNNKSLYENADEVLALCNKAKGISAVFTSYMRTRKMLLTGTEHGSVAYRTVQDNFPVFAENIIRYRFLMDAAPEVTKDAEKTLCVNISDAFAPANYAKYMCQEGIDSYNRILEGFLRSEKEKVNGLNTFIREYNQRKKNDPEYTGRQIVPFKKMKKQILSMHQTMFRLRSFENDQEYVENLLVFKKDIEESNVFTKAVALFSRLEYMMQEGIYIPAKQIGYLAHAMTKQYSFFGDYIFEDIKDKVFAAKKESAKGKKSLTKAEITRAKSQSAKVIPSIARLDRYLADAIATGRVSEYSHRTVAAYLAEHIVELVSVVKKAEGVFDAANITPGNFKNTEKLRNVIKTYLDAVLDVERFVRNYNADISGMNLVETDFYDEMEEIAEDLSTVVAFYNKSRSYLTKKPEDMSKKQQTCLGKTALFSQGWNTASYEEMKKEEQCFLQKDGIWYYATFSSNCMKGISLPTYTEAPDEEYFRKFNITSISDTSKNLPRFVFSNEVKEYFENGGTGSYMRETGMKVPFAIPREIYDIYQEKHFKTDYYNKEKDEAVKEEKRREFKRSLEVMIRFYIEFMKDYLVTMKYRLEDLRDPADYTDLADFYADCNYILTEMSYGYVKAEDVEELEQSGDLYLFKVQIKKLYNSTNMTPYAKYFDYLFSEKNMEEKQLKLNGAPMLKYRPASIERVVTHPAGSMVVNRRDSQGTPIPNEIYKELYLFFNGKKDSLSVNAETYKDRAVVHKTDHDLIKDSRYTADTFLLTVVFTINFDAKYGGNTDVDKCVSEYLRDGSCNILSVARGERDLFYYVLCDMQKNILLEGNLNVLNGTDYRKKLFDLTKERQDLRRNWQDDKKVADLKDGYIREAVSRIVELAVENDAVICIESLSEGFKDKRSCIDNQAYKKFEALLVSRLACYHKVSIPASEPGGVANPLQLANDDPMKADALKNGILFKINPAYVAQACPKTGFVNLFDTRDVTSVKAKKEFLSKFDEIYFDAKRGCFVFRFHYKKMSRLKTDPVQDEWILNTSGTRTRFGKNSGYETVDITSELATTLSDVRVPYKNGEDLLDILKEDDVPSAVVNAIMDTFMTTLYCRNYTNDTEEEPYYYSPAEDSNGSNFDSRSASKGMPSCAGAVKAYNLANKLFFAVEKSKDDAKGRINPAVKNEEYMKYIQGK